MRCAILVVILVLCATMEARKKNAKHTSADEVERPPTVQSTSKGGVDLSGKIEQSLSVMIPTSDGLSASRYAKVDVSPEPPSVSSGSRRDEDNTIEDVDEDKIDEILRDATKNLVIFFYDGRAKCPGCGDALSEVEEIDDDIEATGYIEVVKTDDRSVARELGVTTFPSLVYFRRRNPITYDGDFKDSEVVLRWLRSHDEVVTWDLTDDNFEDKTDSYSPDEGALDWFVMFYNAEEPDCNAFVSSWETVAHRLRGIVHVGKVDTSISDDVTERFRLDDDQCPTYLLFHRGKMYRYKEAAKDIRGLTAFALHKFKEQRGHRIPEPPTALEHFYEHIKERILDILDDSQALSVIGVGGLIVIVAITLFIKARRIQKSATVEKPKAN
ncbi:Thioredoxin domain-containing protein [Toxocara canis]|uniref:Thioredoxin domain-containing protein n=1 Tax=Toxocara canis TaxID=6265 RepID=A0A0B2VG46_TOXCA|nr:Thioredoxin domain-containing protein [Toxocara canis]